MLVCFLLVIDSVVQYVEILWNDNNSSGSGELTVNETVYIFTCCFAECELGLCLLRKDIDGGY